jgi:1,4-dihydroxy-2-naphthoate polyprenyltransferase
VYPLKAWLLAIRPKTLSAAVVPVLVTTALAYANGYTIDGWICICACLSTLCIQIATNLFNDAIDFEKGADTKDRLGPTRVTQAGLLSRKKVYALGALFCLLAFICGIYLVYQGGVAILWIGLVSIILSYLYTGGPLPLAYYGLGDLFVLIFFGWIASITMYYLYAKTVTVDAIVIGTQLGLLCSVLIVINNFRDYANDRLVKKKTLVARFGPNFARSEVVFLFTSAFTLQIYWFWNFKYLAALLPLLLLPLAFHISRFLILNSPSATFNQYLAKSSLLYLLFGLLFSVGILWPMS